MKKNPFACIAVLLFLSLSGCARMASVNPIRIPTTAAMIPITAPEEVATETFMPEPTATTAPTEAPCTQQGWSDIDKNLYNVDMEVLYLEDIDATKRDFQSHSKITGDNLKKVTGIEVSPCTKGDYDLVVEGINLVNGISQDIVAQKKIDKAFLAKENESFAQALSNFQKAEAHLKSVGFPAYPHLESIITHITQIPTILSYHVPMLHY